MNAIKTAKIQYGLLLAGLILMLVLSLLPYATIDFDGNYSSWTGFFNAVLNLDGNDMTSIYRIVTILFMSVIDFTFIVYAALSLIFGLINTVKTIKSKDFEGNVGYLYDNYFKALPKAVLAIVLCAILGSGIQTYAVVLLAVILALPIIVVALNGKFTKDRIIKVASMSALALGTVLLSVSFVPEFNLEQILNTIYSSGVKAGTVLAILTGIAASVAFETQRPLLSKGASTSTVPGKIILSLLGVLSLSALIVNLTAGTLTTGPLVALIIATVLFLAVAAVSYLPAKTEVALTPKPAK
jgi:hypothetical protein